MSTVDQRQAVRRVAAARLISLAGSGAAFAALAYVIYHLTGESNTWVAWTLLLTIGAQGVFVSVASWLGDRFERRRVLVITDLCAAAGFGVLMFMRTPGQYLFVAFLTAVVESPIYAVSSAAVPNLVDEDSLSWANGVVAFGRNVGNLVGPVLGGVTVAVFASGSDPSIVDLHTAAMWVFGLNVVTFLVSAWLIGTTPGRFNDVRDEASEHHGAIAGMRFLVGDPVLQRIAIAWAVLLLGVGMSIVGEVALADEFGSGSLGYGLLASAWGGGAVIGSVLAQRRLRAANEYRSLIGAVLIAGLGFGTTAVAPWLVIALMCMVVGGVGEGVAGVAEQGIFQRRAPDDVRSRVLGALEAIVLISLGLSFVFGGTVVDALGPRITYAIGGLTFLLAAAILAPGYGRMLDIERRP